MKQKKMILLLLAGALFTANASAETDKNKDKDKDKDFVASHVQVATIDVCGDDKSLGFNAFCLDSSGNLLCAVGQSVAVYGRTKNNQPKLKQGIRVFDPSGEQTAFWPLDFSPQAIGYGPDHHIYVGGEGKIAQLNRNGEVVKVTDAPNLSNKAELIKNLKKQHEARVKQTAKSYKMSISRTQSQIKAERARIEKMQESPEAFVEAMKKVSKSEIATVDARIKSYQRTLDRYRELAAKVKDENAKKSYAGVVDSMKRQIAALNKRKASLSATDTDELSDEEFQKRLKVELRRAENKVKSYERTLKTYQQYVKNNANPILSDVQIENMLRQKSKISSISATDTYVYIVCQASEGYGFDVWQTKPNLTEPKKLVKGLRGCCGQMDVQACKNGLFVAENTRHRVVKYGLDGKQVSTFGKRDAKGEKGFGSCCNPMNVCFAQNNTVLTAESGTGRIMQFNEKGEKVGLIGNGRITGGCKNVAVHATHDLSAVYMLDLTGKKICVLKPKSKADGTDEK